MLKEIERVLKPSGKLLCIFPVQDCYRDHAGTLFAHWFPTNSKAQYYSLLFFRILGFGRLKKGKNRDTPRKWAKFFVKWLLENTFYRSKREIDQIFNHHFFTVQHIEEDYMSFRLNELGLRWVPKILNFPVGKQILQRACLRIAGVVVLAEKSVE